MVLTLLQVGKSYSSAREALLLNAKFVATQLGGQEGLNLSATPFMKSVLSEVHSRMLHDNPIPTHQIPHDPLPVH